VLDDVTRNLRRHAPAAATPAAETASLPAPASAEATLREAPAASVATAATAAGGPPRNRDEALRQLEEIAAFFRRTEPHSPVAYLAEKAARWGNMSLHEWLRSVVRDDSALLRVEELLGVEERAGGE
jgi:type VI secretion system protein ImpA